MAHSGGRAMDRAPWAFSALPLHTKVECRAQDQTALAGGGEGAALADIPQRSGEGLLRRARNGAGTTHEKKTRKVNREAQGGGEDGLGNEAK